MPFGECIKTYLAICYFSYLTSVFTTGIKQTSVFLLVFISSLFFCHKSQKSFCRSSPHFHMFDIGQDGQNEPGFCGDFRIFTIGNKSVSVGPQCKGTRDFRVQTHFRYLRVESTPFLEKKQRQFFSANFNKCRRSFVIFGTNHLEDSLN